jgi:hypothetical protein
MPQSELNALENPGQLVSNHEVVAQLQHALVEAPRDMNILRKSLATVLHRKAWLDRLDPDRGDRFKYEAFINFIRAPLPGGLSTHEDVIRRLIADDPKLSVDFEEELQRGPGGNNNPMGVNQHFSPPEVNGAGGTIDLLSSEVNGAGGTIDLAPSPMTPSAPRKRSSHGGNSRAHTIRRLSRAAEGGDAKAAELLDLIRSGEISPHRATKEMGWRRDKAPLEQLRHWWGKASEDERNAFVDEIGRSGWSPM